MTYYRPQTDSKPVRVRSRTARKALAHYEDQLIKKVESALNSVVAQDNTQDDVRVKGLLSCSFTDHY